MNTKCKYLKQKVNKNLECKKDKNRIPFKDCRNCPYKEYKSNNSQIRKPLQINYKQPQTTTKLKNKSNKLARLEKNRSSLFTNDLEHCIICGKSPVNKHEIFGGRNRLNSIKYGLVIPLCTCEHHDQVNCRGIHFDKKLRDEWHKKGQAKFIETYPDLKFEDIFKINYL